MGCFTICRHKSGEPLERRAVKNVSMVMLLATAAVALMILAVCMQRIAESADYPLFAELRILLACTFIGVIALASLLFPGPAIGLGDTLLHGDERHPTGMGAFVFAALQSVAPFATGMMYRPALDGDGGFANREIFVLACCAPGAPWAYGLLVRLIALDIRRYEEWGSLDIAE